MSTSTAIDYTGQSFINFRDFEFEEEGRHRFRWIDSKKFDLLRPDLDDKFVLGALIAHPQFLDDYVGGGLDPEGLRHGPYWLSRISPDTYRKVDNATALDVLEQWISGCGMIPESLRVEIDHKVLDPVREATACYLLRTLDNTAANDYADIHNEFHEIVLIDRGTRRILLIVATDD
ncbi:hypothetical protein [Nocardia panacis]|uniref:hypothetical protein n=1 Tax=Nocardia panacis TaxID=2340916 RepID=UPI0011C36C88|nr:hypothetical protein [Nocardia panacis]